MTKRTSRGARKTSSHTSAAFGRVRSSSGPSVPTDSAQLEAQYQYVIDDLRRIGLIAAALIGGLVVLSLFIK